MLSLATAILLATSRLVTFAIGAELRAGDYSFSDELGGFRLLSASGTGTIDDPVVIVEEVPGVDPVVLVIRRLDMNATGIRRVQGRLTLVKEVINRSERVWAGYDVELREILEKPSTRSDGLSFNQAGAQPSDVQSDTFKLNNRHYEPHDRIAFLGGSLDPGARMRLRITITDPTPVAEFYLVQNPNLLAAGLPGVGDSLAAHARWRAFHIMLSDTHQIVR